MPCGCPPTHLTKGARCGGNTDHTPRPENAGTAAVVSRAAASTPGLESEMDPKPDYGEQSCQGFGRLQGKAAIITGGDSGIGRAVALAFAREGADVLISYLNEESDAQETVRVVREAGRKAVALPGDIGDEAHCQQIIQRAMQEFGKLDILVSNAAFQMSPNRRNSPRPTCSSRRRNRATSRAK